MALVRIALLLGIVALGLAAAVSWPDLRRYFQMRSM
jgi:uncharacterized protein DUF6893